MKALRTMTVVLALAALGGCASEALEADPAPVLAAHARWLVAPFANYTTTPGAGSRAASLTAALLSVHLHGALVIARPRAHAGLPLATAPDPKAWQAAARARGARYIVEGAVQEWRYTIGLDGEPAVAITVSVVSARTGRVLWTAAGSRSGSPRESVGVLAQDTLNAMLHRLTS